MASNRADVSCSCGGIKLCVVKGDLASEKTDAIVCTATKNLDLSRGRASKAILTAAGNILQEDCNQGYPDGIDYGKVAVVTQGKLPCKKVFLVALPIWGKTDKEQKNLETTIDQCLLTAHRKEMASIALPALGTGLLKYPLDAVAKTTVDCVDAFSKANPKTSLRRVKVVVFPKDSAAYQAFEEEVSKRSEEGISSKSEATNHKFKMPENMAKSAVREMGMRSILSGRSMSVEEKPQNIMIRVVSADSVTSRQAKNDVLVNIMRSSRHVDDGEFSVSLLKAAGEQVQIEFNRRYEDDLDPGQVAVTGSHHLEFFKRIFHGYLPKKVSEKSYTSKRTLHRLIENCLQEANQHGFKSITFPALSSDRKNFPASEYADMLCQCIRTFEEETPQSSVHRITIFVEKGQSRSDDLMAIYQEAIDRSVEILDNQHKETSKEYLYQSLEAALKGAIERSDKGPDRGTLDWFKFMYKKDPRTPSYWSDFHSNKTIKEWHMGFDDLRLSIVPVDGRQFVVIDKLVQETWQSQHVGSGRDSSGLSDLNYSNIKVTRVERIENTALFEKYIQTRQEIFRKVIRKGQLKQLDDIQGSKGPILTTKAIDQDCFLTNDIFPEVNEHYMFHGTQDAIVQVIAEQGLDSRLAGSSTMFGQGVYAAESSTKADQYADDKDSRSRFNRKMFLIRMCLGKIHVDATPQPYARPPCTGCSNAKCNCGANDYCDSVVGDGSWNFREFVVYDRSQVYPEYIITYDRVSS